VAAASARPDLFCSSSGTVQGFGQLMVLSFEDNEAEDFVLMTGMKACVMGDISKGRPKSIMEKTCMIPYWF
jgi:hypothetical protein